MQTLHTVGKIFADRLFRIPDYQRGYAWEKQQWQDFIEDLELLPENKQHYLGTLILHQRADVKNLVDEEGQSYTTYDVVDGQQRLTTIVLFLDALREEMHAMDGQMANLAQGIYRTYIAVCRLEDGQHVPKLTLNRDSHSFFYDVVLAGTRIAAPTIRSHKQLVGAKAYFADYFRDKQDELGKGYPNWLRAQYLKVATRLTTMVYALESEADAGVVFETMNNRGKELTELEKVKNYLLYLASKVDLPAGRDLATRINQTWTHIFESLMAADLGDLRNEDQLLRAHWLMAYDHDRSRWAGSRSIKTRFSLRDYEGRHRALLQGLVAYLDGLANATVAYCDVYKPLHPNAFRALTDDPKLRAQIAAAGARFARLGAPVTFLPLLMAVRIRAPQEPKTYLEALDLAETFAFRVYRWAEKRANTGQSWMFRLAHELFDGRDLSSVLNSIREAIFYYCSDKQLEDRFDQQEIDWYRWWGLKYFLYEYEHHLAQQAGQDVRMPWETLTRKKDTIEHILPQTLDRGGFWRARFSPTDHRRYVHDIGNLTLTFDNSVLGNKPFPEKKGAPGQEGTYAGSKLFIEQQLARYQDWSPAQVEERRKQIKAWALKRWRIESATSRSETGQPVPYSVESIVQLAEHNGVAAPFQALVDAAHRHNIHLRPHKHCMVFAPPQNGTWTLFTVWPKPSKLETGVWFSVFSKFFGLSREKLDAILGPKEYRTLTAENVEAFVAQLDHFFSIVNGTTDISDPDRDRVQQIRRVLTRRFIPWGQMSVYHALYNAGERWVSITELADQIRDGDSSSLGGVFGALGRRVNSTRGFGQGKPGIEALFQVTIREGKLEYRMHPETHAAIEGLPGLRAMMDWSLQDILAEYREKWWPNPEAQRGQLGL